MLLSLLKLITRIMMLLLEIYWMMYLLILLIHNLLRIFSLNSIFILFPNSNLLWPLLLELWGEVFHLVKESNGREKELSSTLYLIMIFWKRKLELSRNFVPKQSKMLSHLRIILIKMESILYSIILLMWLLGCFRVLY